jgi:hypothetical protein
MSCLRNKTNRSARGFVITAEALIQSFVVVSWIPGHPRLFAGGGW